MRPGAHVMDFLTKDTYGIFDDGSPQSIVDTARQQIDKPPAVFVEVFSGALPGNKDPIIAAPPLSLDSRRS
jgi:hypothetical protein